VHVHFGFHFQEPLSEGCLQIIRVARILDILRKMPRIVKVGVNRAGQNHCSVCGLYIGDFLLTLSFAHAACVGLARPIQLHNMCLCLNYLCLNIRMYMRHLFICMVLADPFHIYMVICSVYNIFEFCVCVCVCVCIVCVRVCVCVCTRLWPLLLVETFVQTSTYLAEVIILQRMVSKDLLDVLGLGFMVRFER
jgi:hypothetical protein